jgi:acyl-CoA thioesterase-2
MLLMADLDMTASIRTPVHEILALEAVGEDRFIGCVRHFNHIGGVYGGQLLAHGLLSAVRSVEAMPPTSLHGYFMATAAVGTPIEYRVSRLRDSRRFANRQVMAIQDGRLVFTLICEFHAPEEGFVHQSAVMPDVPPPERVPTLQQFAIEHRDRLDPMVVRNLSGALPMEVRAVDVGSYFLEPGQYPARSFWFRLPGADRKSTRLNSSHNPASRMPSSA